MGLFMSYDYSDDLFACRLVGFAGQVDGSVGLKGQDAELQFAAILWQSPETIHERTAIVEVIGH